VSIAPSAIAFAIVFGEVDSCFCMSDKSLQEEYAPKNVCFGCGPANPDGLHIRSFPKNGEVVAEWKPGKKYEAFDGVLNGGIIGTLLDCHCNWTAAYHLMKRAGENRPPCTVTAEYAIKLLRPTPTKDSVFLSAKIVEIANNRATVEGKLSAGGKVCATCRGVFVAVKEDHPAYHRW
jgi:acyl-coenzyme A thioesterase PaaI-like protein